MKRERLWVGEVLRRTTKVMAELVDEHDLGDDAAHTVADGLEEMAHDYLGIERLPSSLSGRAALDHLLEELEDMLAA